MEKSNIQHKLLKAYVNVCRFFLSAVFVFSGFVKANDPLGLQYKLAEYAGAFGFELPDFLLMILGAFLATVEFTLGVYLFFGINRRLTTWLVMAMMSVMTPLTLYLALENPVSDCGCFGDAVVLTNWQTFWKNVVISFAAFSVLWWKNEMFRMVTRRIEWLISFYSIGYVLVFFYYTQIGLPVIDFRPYHVGADIAEGMTVSDESDLPVYETRFVMEKDGVRQEFLLEDYPDSAWTFVERKTILVKEGALPPIQDFSLVRLADGEDVTEDVLADSGYTFLLVLPQLQAADDGYADLLNELYDYCQSYDYTFYGVTASQEEAVEWWQDRTGGEYPFCHADELMLKTMVRSNPGLILLKEGKVVNKWSNRNIPDEYELTGRLEELPLTLQVEAKMWKEVLLCVWWYVGPLAFFAILDGIYSRFRVRRIRRNQDSF